MDLEKLRAIEEARRQLEPYRDEIERHRRVREQIAPLQEEIERRRRMQEALGTISLQQYHALKSEMSEALQLVAQRVIADVKEIQDAFRMAASPLVEVSRQAAQWRLAINEQYKSSATALAQAVNAGAVWRDEIAQLVRTVQAYRLDVQFPVLADRIFRPSEYFTNYTQSRTEQLDTTESEDERAIISGALGLAEIEFSDGVSLTESLISSDVSIIESSSPILYNLYEEQEEELILLVGKGFSRVESISSIFEKLRTTELSKMASQVIRLVTLCNQENKIRGGDDIFKLTNALLEAAADLPLLIVKSKGELLALVIHLYRLIYEGAGTDNLRFLKQNGGQLEPDECQVVWTLKTLRNKLTTHDPEHGNESKIRKAYSDLGAALHSLGLDGYPVTKDDYLTLQKTLLTQTSNFLSSLIEKMQRQMDSPT